MRREFLHTVVGFVVIFTVGCAKPPTTIYHVHQYQVVRESTFSCEGRQRPALPEPRDAEPAVGQAKADNNQPDFVVLETRLFPMPTGIPPEPVAAAFCAQIASPKGRANVIGSLVLARDLTGSLDELEILINEVDAMQKGARKGGIVRSPRR